jgi:eukaryotic-like serine/threonine-protein kinase
MAPTLSTMTVLTVAYLFGRQDGATWPGLCLTVAAGVVWLVGSVLGSKASASAPSKTEEKLGPYTLDEKIGEGGMGVVYKASHELLRRPAAIKLLAPERTGEENLKRFEREVQVTSMLTHPNTVAIYDFGRTSAGAFYYAMEYLEGLDLQTLVEEHGPQEPARVAHILAQLAGALAEAHGAGVVHRDVKPANVMLCERGGRPDVAKVLDFGLTKDLSPHNDVVRSDVHRIVGTPLYLSPEAVTDPGSVDARSDLYAVGAVGYFLLTGAPPFSGKNAIELCGHHLYSTPTPISVRRGAPVPAELEALVMSCLEKRPGNRPASAAALQSALASFAAQWTEESARAWWNERQETARSHEPRELAQTVRASGLPLTESHLAARAA